MTVAPEAPSTTQERIHDTLRSYFQGRNVTIDTDSMWTKMLEGFLVQVASRSWTGWVKVLPDDLGLPAESDAYKALNLRWGSIKILHPEVANALNKIRTNAIRLPKKWGRKVRWGMYIPMTAMKRFRDEFQELETDWNKAIRSWIDGYDEYYQYAIDQTALLAKQAATVADQLHVANPLSQDAIQTRILDYYPMPDVIAEYQITYDVNFIPTPQLAAKHIADLEVIEQQKRVQLEELRRITEQREFEFEEERLKALNAIDIQERIQEDRMEVMRSERQRLQTDLAAQRDKLLDEFYQGYAIEIRQRLHEALQYAIEGVRQGKLAPSATRSLRNVLDEISSLAMDEDQEMVEMSAHLDRLLSTRVSAAGERVQQLETTIEELGILLQTSILAMGEQPRMPSRSHDLPAVQGQDILAELKGIDLDQRVRQARETVGLSCSLAEDLISGSGLTLGDLERRSRRFEE